MTTSNIDEIIESRTIDIPIETKIDYFPSKIYQCKIQMEEVEDFFPSQLDFVFSLETSSMSGKPYYSTSINLHHSITFFIIIWCLSRLLFGVVFGLKN